MRNRVIVITLAIATACITGVGIWQGRINGVAEVLFNDVVRQENISLKPDDAMIFLINS